MPSLEIAPVGWHFATESGDQAMTARKFASVKFPDAFVEDARREATLFNRSVAGQIEHWARLGRALEGTPGLSVGRIRQALEGKIMLDDLTGAEQEAFLDQMEVWLDHPSEGEVAAYRALGELPGAVGLDGRGRLIENPLKPSIKRAR